MFKSEIISIPMKLIVIFFCNSFFLGFHPVERVGPRQRGPLVRGRSRSLVLGLDSGALRQKVRKYVGHGERG